MLVGRSTFVVYCFIAVRSDLCGEQCTWTTLALHAACLTPDVAGHRSVAARHRSLRACGPPNACAVDSHRFGGSLRRYARPLPPCTRIRRCSRRHRRAAAARAAAACTPTHLAVHTATPAARCSLRLAIAGPSAALGCSQEPPCPPMPAARSTLPSLSQHPPGTRHASINCKPNQPGADTQHVGTTAHAKMDGWLCTQTTTATQQHPHAGLLRCSMSPKGRSPQPPPRRRSPAPPPGGPPRCAAPSTA